MASNLLEDSDKAQIRAGDPTGRTFKPEGIIHMLMLITKFAADDNGAAGVEYGLLIALIAAVIVGSVATLGTTLKNSFNNVNAALAAALG